MSDPAKSDVQNLLPVQAYFDVNGNFQTFIGQNKPFYATPDPNQSGLHITNSTIDSSVIGGITPAAGTFTSITGTTGTIATAPVGPTDIVNKTYVDFLATGLAWKQPVICATTPSGGNINLTGLQTIDTVTVTAGQRVLVKNQTNQAENGIYLASASAWTRAEDANTWDELVGAIVFIVEGGQKDSAWYSTIQAGGTLGVTPIVWGNFTISAIYTAGTGLQLIGTEFSIANTSVVAGSYGAASKTLSATVNAQGQLTGLSAQDISIAATQITSGTIDSARLSGSYTGITGVGTLTAGTWQAGTIAVLYGGTGATTASGARTNLGAAASGANSDITSMTGITGGISTPTFIQWGNGTGQSLVAGKQFYDPATGSHNMIMGGGNITQQVGEEIFVYGKASAAITEGQLICKTGVVGASGQITFGPSAANLADNDGIIGVATENIASGSFGRITYFGVVHGIDTSGTSSGQTWADGDTLWYNPAGGGLLTNVKPSAPNIKYQIATVIHAGNGGSGSIQVDLQAGSTLGGTDNNVQISSVANLNLLQYDSVSGYWKNVAASSITVGSVANAVTFNSSGGAAAGTSFNGSVARTVDYSTVGAPSATGTGASGTWSISITGNAGTATKATNIAGGAAGSLPYNTAADTTSFLALGTTNYVLTAGASAPQYVAQSTLSVGSATNATNIAITDNTSSSATWYPVLSANSSGNNGATTSSTKISFVPSTGTMGLGSLTLGGATQNQQLGEGNASIMKNRLINGAFTINQYALGTVTPTGNQYIIDRWLANLTVASKFSVQQSTDAPAGFTNSALITSTSAYTVASGDYNTFQQRIEANNMFDMGWGTANAKTVTLSFWIKSSLTGTFGGSFYFPASTARSYPFSYSIPVANTWTKISITIAGDTTTNTAPTGTSLYVIVQWALGVGTTFSGTAGSWVNGNYASVTGATNLIATNGATWQITAAQLEAGSYATGYEYRQYTTEQALAQRYYYKQVNYMGQSAPYNSENTGAHGFASGSSTVYRISKPHPVQMRATPTITYANVDIWGGTQNSVTSINNNNSSIYTRSMDYNLTGSAGGSGAIATEFVMPSGYIDCSAEL